MKFQTKKGIIQSNSLVRQDGQFRSSIRLPLSFTPDAYSHQSGQVYRIQKRSQTWDAMQNGHVSYAKLWIENFLSFLFKRTFLGSLLRIVEHSSSPFHFKWSSTFLLNAQKLWGLAILRCRNGPWFKRLTSTAFDCFKFNVSFLLPLKAADALIKPSIVVVLTAATEMQWQSCRWDSWKQVVRFLQNLNLNRNAMHKYREWKIPNKQTNCHAHRRTCEWVVRSVCSPAFGTSISTLRNLSSCNSNFC